MISAIAVLNYRRGAVLKVFIDSLLERCPKYPTAVFEDCANYDGATAYLIEGAKFTGYDVELDSDHYLRPDGIEVFLARRNEGVAGNSNKAIKWFERGKWDHLCLCNDDLVATGDFPAHYLSAHQKLGVGLFCFFDNPAPMYTGPVVPAKGFKVKMMPRMVGAMMSMTKKVVEHVGYYDATFGGFGEEHSEFTNRARFMGFCSLNGKGYMNLDLEQTLLKSQPTPSSILPYEKPALDRRAAEDINRAASRLSYEHPYRPFRLPHPLHADNFGGPGYGLEVHALERVGYEFVTDRMNS